MSSESKPLAITMGDPAGIGPEIIAKAFRDAPWVTAGCFVVGDVATLRRASAVVSGPGRPLIPVARIDAPSAALAAPPRCIPVLQATRSEAPVEFGRVSAIAGKAAAECVVWTARAALRKDISAMVTAPVHKEALAAAGVPYPGHTELLQAESATFLGKAVADVPVRMMLANEELRTVLVSIHVALRDAIAAVTLENLFHTLRITHESVGALLHRTPRIGVAGLNPHAGEGGLFGREEMDVITPAIEAARKAGMDVSGPFAPDTVFMRARTTANRPGEFDVVIAMYHDQGLIPVKYLGVDKGVNVTLGLPLRRTSPDHGTAFDLAGTGQADPSSLIEAIRFARGLRT